MVECSVQKFYPKNAASNPDNVFEQAVGQYESAVVIGWNKDGTLDVRASLNIDHKEINWLISVFQHKLLSGDYSADTN